MRFFDASGKLIGPDMDAVTERFCFTVKGRK
jgi:hypothetical protein